MQYEFNLKFKLGVGGTNHDEIMRRLADAGCTDALVGFGLPGSVGLEFIREADSAVDAILSALSEVRVALPESPLVEAGPDFVGLTDVADLLGMSRQNMRKLYVSNESFPPPVHGGASTCWHLALVLRFLNERQYPVAPEVLEVASTTMQLNLAKEKSLIDLQLGDRLPDHLFA